MADDAEVVAVLKELHDHSIGGARCSAAWAPTHQRPLVLFPSLSPHNPLTHSASARAAEFPEDDAKRAAEQLKGIIHDTDGAT